MEPIVQTYRLDARPDEVWRALTDPTELDRWWTTRSESEVETGGRFRYVWEFEEAEKNGKQEGRYVEVDAPHRIRYPWEAGVETEVEFRLEASDGGTELTLRHSGWQEGMDEVREMISNAWGMFLGNLKSVLEDGVDRRAELAGQKVV